MRHPNREIVFRVCVCVACVRACVRAAAAAVRVVLGLPGSGSAAPAGLVGMKPSLLTADPRPGDVDPRRAQGTVKRTAGRQLGDS